MWDIKSEVEAAQSRIRKFVHLTPLERSPVLSDLVGRQVSLKLESLQYSGSFKIRGATNKLLSLTEKQRKAGFIAASTGNHGLAVAHAAHELGLDGTIFLPETAAPHKVQLLQCYNVTLQVHGSDSGETEAHARRVSDESERPFISPYNDPQVVAGQGTVGWELLHQDDSVDCVLLAVGGGGLISGVGGFIKETSDNVRIIGCLPGASPVMFDSIRAGRVVDSDVQPTLSDGTAGGIEEGAITLELCQRYVNDWVLVSETEIRRAVRLLFSEQNLVIEGAAGVAVAALLKADDRLKDMNHIAVVICGGNIDTRTLEEILDH